MSSLRFVANRLSIAAFSLGAASACSGQVPTPSAYSSQRYLCGAADADLYRAAVDDCIAKSCAGVFSMTGLLESEPVTVESALTGTTIVLAQQGSVRFLDELKLSGRSPYFEYVFHVRSIGGDVSESLATPKVLPIDVNARYGKDRLTNGRVEAGILLQVAGNSSEEHALTDSGDVTISRESETEIVGTFDGTFTAEPNRLTGCFTVFPSTEIINPFGAQ